MAATEGRLGAQAQRCDRLVIGDRNNGFEVGVGDAAIRLPVEAVLVFSNRSGPTMLERALQAAGEAIDGQLTVAACRVVADGSLMAELVPRDGAGERAWFLRFHDGTPASAATVERLLSCGPPAEVRDRLVTPVATGHEGGLDWSVEEKAVGGHPGALGPGLWSECASFLTALGGVSPGSLEQTVDGGPSLLAEAPLLEPFLSESDRQALQRLAAEADRRLAALPRRWGHGDFHPANLIVRNGRLDKVLDWDAASPRALPGLDLLHLIATTDPALRRMPHGVRCSGPLLEWARCEEGRPLRAWLEAAGVSADAETLRALIAAYWLGRVARDLHTFPDRSGRERWIELNVRRPVVSSALLRRSDGDE